jgi:hypothetical protein
LDRSDGYPFPFVKNFQVVDSVILFSFSSGRQPKMVVGHLWSKQAKECRVIPLFPEWQSALEEAWELTPEGTVYVVDEKYRKAANTVTG